MNRATAITCAALMVGGLTAGTALRRWIPDRCAPPAEAEKARLINFIRTKYKLPPGAQIGVADGGVALGSCFRNLVFASLGGPHFRAELFASPDYRYLTNELLDGRLDPKEVAERQRQTAESLASGNLPVRGTGKAPVTLAVFSDFQCAYCARRHLPAIGPDGRNVHDHYLAGWLQGRGVQGRRVGRRPAAQGALNKSSIDQSEFKKYVWPVLAMQMSGSNTNADKYYPTYQKVSQVGITESNTALAGKKWESSRSTWGHPNGRARGFNSLDHLQSHCATKAARKRR